MSPEFRRHFKKLSPETQQLARGLYRVFRKDPSHDTLSAKTWNRGNEKIYQVRVGFYFRARAILHSDKKGQAFVWYWIGMRRDAHKH